MNTTAKINGEIVLMEKFLNSNLRKYSKVYVRISGTQNDAKLLRAKARSISKARLFIQPATPYSNESTSEAEALLSSSSLGPAVHNSDDNLLFKLRTVYFTNGLPVYKQAVSDILKRAWSAKLDKKKFESQNGLRVIVNIYDTAHYLTTKNENVYGFRYTVSINGQDPEFLAVAEPTYAEYERETNADAEKSLKFCASNAFEIERLYISTSKAADFSASAASSVALVEEKINKILARVWNQLNDVEITGNRALPNNRIVGKSKLETGFFSLLRQNVSRLSISWLVDGSLPNPIYFKRPSIDDVLPYLTSSGIHVYDGTPLINASLQISSASMLSSLDQLKVGLQNAWRKANPNIRHDYFYVLVENNNRVNKTVVKRDSSGTETKIVYFVGIQDKTFDASEIKKPTLKIVQEELKRLVPEIKFGDDKTVEFVDVSANRSDTSSLEDLSDLVVNKTADNVTRKTKLIPVIT